MRPTGTQCRRGRMKVRHGVQPTYRHVDTETTPTTSVDWTVCCGSPNLACAVAGL